MQVKANSDFKRKFHSKIKKNKFSTHQSDPLIESLTILQKIAKADKAAVKDCVDVYGSKIWSVARTFTDSSTVAEIITREIFLDIWRYARRYRATDYDEPIFISMIVKRRIRALNKLKKTEINSK